MGLSGELRTDAGEFFRHAAENRVDSAYALRRELAGMVIYDEPIFAVADARDPLFEGLKQAAAIGPHFLTPIEWLSSAQTVLAYFFTFFRSGTAQQSKRSPASFHRVAAWAD